MRRMKNLKGVLVPMVIPMFEAGGLDLDGTRRLAERFLSLSSVNGLFALGASSEFMHQPFEERKALIEVLARVERSEKVITAHTGGLPQEQVIELTRLVGKLGLDAAAVIIPNDVPQDVDAVKGYFQKIAATGIPFTVYWSPIASDHKPSPEIVEGLLGFRQFVGLKDSSRNMVSFTDICTRYGQTISAFQGVEMLHLASLAVGSAGVVGGGLNLYPGLLAAITEAFRSGEWEKARTLQRKVNESWYSLAAGKAFRSICKQYWKGQGILEGTYCREGNNISLSGERMKEVERIVDL